jgi:hypothetical protein
MDALVFFIPVALVVAQYFTGKHSDRAEIAREAARRESCCA